MPPDSVLFLRAQKQQTHYHDERDQAEQRLCVQAVHDFSLRPATTHSELATANL